MSPAPTSPPTEQDNAPSSTSPSSVISPDLLAYLDDLALAALVFEHATPFAQPLHPPIYSNPACHRLLRQGRKQPGNGEVAVEDSFTDCITEAVGQTLNSWLKDGADTQQASTATSTSSSSTSPSSSSSAPPSSSSTSSTVSSSSSPTRPRPPPRTISVKLHDRISFPPIHFGASVQKDYTVLTQLPPHELARGTLANISASTSPALSPAGSSSTRLRYEVKSEEEEQALEQAVEEEEQRMERIGEVEVAAEKVIDATTVEGLAYTQWNLPVGAFRVDRQFSLQQVNPCWRKTTSLPIGESNDAWTTRVHPEDQEAMVANYKQVVVDLEAGRPQEHNEFEFRWLSTDGGEEQWCLGVVEPCRVLGEIVGYTGICVNINKHKAAETASEQRERQLRDELALLSEACQVGLSRHSKDGTFQTVNAAWREITGVKEDEPLDCWRAKLHVDDRERVESAWAGALRAQEPLNIRFRWQETGNTCLVQVRPYGQHWIGSVTNVTAQVEAEEAVLRLSQEREERAKVEAEQAQEKAKAAVEEKRQQELLIDVTSHEIRNPISAILQNADFTRSSLKSLRKTLLRLKDSSSLPAELDGALLDDLEEDIEALDSITQCGLAQERIANDILGLAQIQLSKYTITPVEFDLASSLKNICRIFKTECRSKDIELRLVIGSSLARLGPRARVFADPARLTQILVNLLSNAIRFTAKSETRIVTLAVEVSTKAPERDAPLVPPHDTETKIHTKRPVYLYFSVEDTGPGMTSEECGKLFAKFSQASPFTHTTWGGSGLGLWIARNLCELQAGRIEVASTVGKGSIFRCFTSARSVDAGPSDGGDSLAVIEGITAPNAHRGEAPRVYLAKPGENGGKLSGLAILCCEDNQINRTVLKRQLTKEGCKDLLLACDGQEGLDLLHSRGAGEIDCILMDIEMPVLDGLAATRAIRKEEREGLRAGHQRIVGLTGNARDAQRQLALDAGMDTVVTKPYKIADLCQTITNGIEPASTPPSRLSEAPPPSSASPPNNSTSPPADSTSHSTDDALSSASSHLSPDTAGKEASIEIDKDVTVVSLTGDVSALESWKKRDPGAHTFEASVERHGEGMQLPDSHDVRAEEKEREEEEDEKTLEKRTADKKEGYERSEVKERAHSGEVHIWSKE